MRPRLFQCGAWAPVIMAARSSGCRNEAGGGGPRRTGRAPLQVFRGPQLVVHDAVHVRVVLGEVARRVLEVPEEVGPGVVPPEPPDVPFRPPFEHRERAPAHLVDVVHLPGRVVQEVDRRGQHEDVVVVAGAAHERAHPGDPVADLETEAVGEERRRAAVVGAAQHGVAELARAHRARPGETRSPGVRAVGPARTVVCLGDDERLLDPGRDVQEDLGAGDRLRGLQARPGDDRGDAEALQAGRGAREVVLVIHADPHLDQPPGGGSHDPQLAARVGGAEPAAAVRDQAEVGVVGGGLVDVRHADRD